MEIKQQLRLSQQLVMTPQLQQAIRLLQLSRLELIDEVRKELDNNPVLSEDEPEPRAAAGPGAPPVAPVAPAARAEQPVYERVGRTDETRDTEKAAREVAWEKFLENPTLQQP